MLDEHNIFAYGGEHDAFRVPASLDEPIWRYMSLAQLLALLGTNQLHFARLSTGSEKRGDLSEAG